MQKYIIGMLILALPLLSPAQVSPISPEHLRCEYRENPLGMDVAHPRLSWWLRSAMTGQYQSAYRILLTTNSRSLDDNPGADWDSGKITDSENINLVPGGKPLKPFTRYYWKVMVWDRQGRPGKWSPVAWFETGMLDSANWQGKWISEAKPAPASEEDLYKDDPAPVFRKIFTLSRPVRSARLYISGLGYNESSINGKKVGDALLDPAWTDPRHTIFYSVYDVGAMLHSGKNTIAALVGNGWYNPLPMRFWGRINFRMALSIGRPKLLANLRIVYTDGSIETIATDESWQAGESAILRNNVFLGEKVDGRRVPDNWKAAIAAEPPGGLLIAAMMPSIGIRKTILPTRVTEPAPHVYVVDMGENFAGVVRMRVRGHTGQAVHLRYGEILQPDGRVNGLTTVAGQIKEMRHVDGGSGAPPTAWQEDVYICRGDSSEIFQPRFTFHGFRYVEITGLGDRPAPADILGLPLSTKVPASGQFECSDTLLNRIGKMVTNTFLSNLFSVQSDCPGREKQGYGGDMVATADAFIYNFDMSCFYTKTIGDFADAVRPNGGMPECAPFNGIADEGFGEGTGPIGWQLAFPFLQRELYRYYGNRRIIEEQYEKSVRLAEFLHSQAKDGLIDHGIGDHEAVNPKHVPLTSAAFYYGHLRLLAELAGILGKTDDQQRWSVLADSVKAAFNSRYGQNDRARYDTAANQTTQVFPLWWGLAKDPQKSFAALLQLIEDSCRGHLSTGIFGTKMLFDVLRRFDRNDLAYKIATQRDFPGYAYMLDHGATTLIESWALTDQNSWDHPMFGSVSEWFYRGLAGINPAEDACGLDRLLFRLRPVPGLSHVRASVASVRGPILSEWTMHGGVFDWEVTIPPNTRAEVDVPAGANDRVTADGAVLASALWSNGFFRMPIVSGSHRFIVKKQ
jgi:alpha-L-rhamnosidase